MDIVFNENNSPGDPAESNRRATQFSGAEGSKIEQLKMLQPTQ